MSAACVMQATELYIWLCLVPSDGRKGVIKVVYSVMEGLGLEGYMDPLYIICLLLVRITALVLCIIR